MKEREKIKMHMVDMKSMQGGGGGRERQKKNKRVREGEGRRETRAAAVGWLLRRADLGGQRVGGWLGKREIEKKNERERKDIEALRESKRRRGEERDSEQEIPFEILR